MQGEPEIIEFLNEALTAELTAVNQYFIHSKLCANWGWDRLADRNRDESIEEMKDAERLIERIIYLEGMPNMQRLGTVGVGENVPEQLDLDNELERAAIDRYRRGIQLCLDRGDAGTRELLEDLLVGEEEHLDWIETQQSAMRDVGLELYLQSQMHD